MLQDKSSSFEQNASKENFENQVKIIKEAWNETIIDLAKQRSAKSQIDIKNITPENASSMLEQVTNTDNKKSDDFIVLTAPTGVGKGTVGGLLEQQGINKMPRVNTRPIRPGEVDGKDYFFVNEDKYDEMVNNKEMFCMTSTAEESKKELSKGAEQSRAGIDIKVFNDWINKKQPFYIDAGAGTARKIKEEMAEREGNFEVIFLLPPTFDEMINRINNRRAIESAKGGKTMSDETLLNRLNIAVGHLKKSLDNTDTYVVNDAADRATQVIQKHFTA